MQYGRRMIFTDVEKITSENVIEVLRNAMLVHSSNAADCEELLNFEAGVQPLQRKKTYRSEIDCKCVDNIANEVTEFKLGFNWGHPITLSQCGENEESDKEVAEAISLLNKCYKAEKNEEKTQELARFIEITGIGYTFVDIKTDWQEGDSYFEFEVLDPRTTFIVYSSRYLDKRPMLGVTFRKDDSGNTYFTCFSNDFRFEIENENKITNGSVAEDWKQGNRSGEANPLSGIPIIGWIRSFDRMGCFERQISEMNNLNLLISDFSNDVDQNTQAIWHGNDVVFPTEIVTDANGNQTEVTKKPATNDWILTYTPDNGKSPFVKPLAVEYDYQGMLNNIITRRALILQKCNVPQRNDNSGGSTGIAMSDATGWSAAEASACKQQNIIEGCKMEEIKIVLRAIKKSPNVPQGSPLLKLVYSDIQPNIKRQKTYEMTTKANAFATWVSHGINGLHALKAINAFDDVNQVWEDSREKIEKYQASIFEPKSSNQAVGGIEEKQPNADRLEADYSDQTQNSPSIDSNRTK